MGLPGALSNLHIREHCREGGFFRRAGINAKADLVCCGIHVSDAHLAEDYSIVGTLNTEVILPAGKTVPHGLHLGRYSRSGPVGVAVVGCHAAQMLELLILELHRTLEPVIAIQIHHDAALVEALMTLREVRLHHKAEELLPGPHLQNRRVVVPEMVVRTLPKVRMRSCSDGDDAVLDLEVGRFSGPLELVQIDLATVGKGISYTVGKISVRCFLGRVATSDCTEAKAKAKEFGDVAHMVDCICDSINLNLACIHSRWLYSPINL